MNTKELFKSVCKGVEAKKGAPLLEHEKIHVVNQFKKIKFEEFAGSDVGTLIVAIVNTIYDGISRLPTPKKEAAIDVKEMLVSQMKNDNHTVTDYSVNYLLSHPKKLQNIINPIALKKHGYIILDRKYQAAGADNIREFTWNLAIGKGSSVAATSALVSAPMKNIAAIKMTPFLFPNTINALNKKRLTVEVVELNNQSYILNVERRKYHFIFEIAEGKTSATMYETNDIGNRAAEFYFHEPIKNVDTLTLKFGNPNKILELDADRVNATVASVGVQTVLTMSNAHRCAVGDMIVISGFSTSDVNSDRAIINQINNIDGHAITAVTDTTITIDVDISGLAGVISGDVNVYLESKRFEIQMELEYYDYEE